MGTNEDRGGRQWSPRMDVHKVKREGDSGDHGCQERRSSHNIHLTLTTDTAELSELSWKE